MKKGKGAVDNVTDATGKTYLPGDIVDLPESYFGEAWLERVEPKKKAVAPPASLEHKEAPALSVPLEASTTKKTQRKSRSSDYERPKEVTSA